MQGSKGSSPALAGGGGSEQLLLQGAWLLRMEAEGEEGWGLGTSASPLLSGEEEEEQLQTCLSAQLFVSRSPRETEAAGSRKSRPAGPAVLLPRPQVLTPEQNRQTRRDWKGPPSPHLRRASLGPLCPSLLCRHPCAILAGGSILTGRGGQGPHQGGRVIAGGRVLPGGSVLTGRQGPCWGQRPCQGQDPGRGKCPRWGQSHPGQHSPAGLALAQTFPGPCLFCLPCELPSPWGPKPLGAGLCISWSKRVTNSLQQDCPSPAPSP